MVYIQIGKKKYPCEIQVFHTQIGSNAIRVISETAPVADAGFKLFNDDTEIADMSNYTHLLREDGDVKEYTQEAEEIIYAEGYVSGVPTNPIAQQFANVNRRITAITPYESTKKAYFGEIEKVFYGVPKGVLSVHMDGEYSVERIEDMVRIKFERLEETKDITIVVQ